MTTHYQRTKRYGKKFAKNLSTYLKEGSEMDHTTTDWIDNNGCLTRGKYKGRQVATIARDDPDYLQWVMDLDDTSVDDRRIIATQLKYMR